VEHGQQTIIKVRLSDLVNGGNVGENVPLKPGDVLVVPQSLF
jgi:polysaccharide export outer membrane protein